MSGPALTLERLYASPSLNGPSPRGVKFSPDGTRVTFLKAREDDQSRFDLWQFDVATGAQSMLVDSTLLEPEEVELSEEEKALRERKRIAGSKGIVSYDWGTADTILVPLGGDLHLVTLTESGPEARRLTETEAFEYDARVSPDGSHVSFVRDGAVYAIELANGEETRLTPLAEPDKAVSYGVAEFVAQEEMSRYTGYWWSPDGKYVAYTRVDESTVDVIPRFDIAAEKVTVIEQRYPRAGRPNAVVDLFVRDMQTGTVHEVSWRREDWGPATDQYLTRVNWAGSALIVQAVNRDQTEIRATQHWPETLFSREAFFTEDQDNWVNLNSDFMVLKSEPGNIHRQGEITLFTTMETEGYRNIVKVGPDGLQPVVMRGDWAVDEIVGRSDEAIFFTGYIDTPLERHLYRVPLPLTDAELEENGWERLPDSPCIDLEPYSARLSQSCPVPVRITEPGQSWSVTMSPDGQSFVGTSSSPTQPPQTGLYRVDGPFFPGAGLLRIDLTDAATELGVTAQDIAERVGAYYHGVKVINLLDETGELLIDTAIGPQNRITVSSLTNIFLHLDDSQSVRIGDITKVSEVPVSYLELITWIEENALDESHPYFPYLADHTVPEYGTLEAEDGKTLYYSIQTPPDFDPANQYPVIVEVYGGPHVQTVTRNWERMSDQYLTREGYIVFQLDNRGSANRGKAFEDVIYRRTGGPEVHDQLVGVDWLKSQPFVDPDRIAIQGWSYGGYMTLMTILQAPEGTFAAAVAGAPVTDWALYDTFYTERYMDTPQDNPDGYERSSVFYHLDRLEGDLTPLLLIHGMADDNVTFDNSTRLMAALQQAGQEFELMTYPGQRHGIRGEALQVHLMKTRMAFLDRLLKSDGE